MIPGYLDCNDFRLVVSAIFEIFANIITAVLNRASGLRYTLNEKDPDCNEMFQSVLTLEVDARS